MANSFGDTVSDLDYYRQRFESWRDEANRQRAALERIRLAVDTTGGQVDRMWIVDSCDEALGSPVQIPRAIGSDVQQHPTHCSLCSGALSEHTDQACREWCRHEIKRLKDDLTERQHAIVNREGQALFSEGEFELASGVRTWWKIEADALTWADWRCLARLIAARVQFSAVEGVPRGGEKLAACLKHLRSAVGPLLIVDDVCTTGESLERQRAGREAIGFVVWARGPVPNWTRALFWMDDAIRKQQELEDLSKLIGMHWRCGRCGQWHHAIEGVCPSSPAEVLARRRAGREDQDE